MTKHERPVAPKDGKPVWYRGWEISWDESSSYWVGLGWQACKGGADLGCEHFNVALFGAALDEIDELEAAA